MTLQFPNQRFIFYLTFPLSLLTPESGDDRQLYNIFSTFIFASTQHSPPVIVDLINSYNEKMKKYDYKVRIFSKTSFKTKWFYKKGKKHIIGNNYSFYLNKVKQTKKYT